MTWNVVICVHVTPDADLLEHELSPHCVCSPEEAETTNDKGEPMYMFTHSALDERDQREQVVQ